MTTKYVQDGRILTLVAPSGGVTVNVPKAIGKLVVLPMVTAAEGESFAAYVEGVIKVTKVGSQAWTEGALVYWDAGDSRFTTTAADGVPAGIATAAVASGAGDTTGYVKLNATGQAQAATAAAIDTADGSDAATTQALANATKAKVNDILTALKAAGLMASA